jgi:hypothetical protein
MTKPTSYYALIEAFPGAGCAVCKLLLRDVERYLESILYEYVLEPETHKSFRAMRGLCNAHSWQLTQTRGNAVGIAVLYKAVVDEVLKDIARTPVEPDQRRGLARFTSTTSDGAALSEALEPRDPCSACQLINKYEKSYLTVFSDHLTDAKFWAAYRDSHGLCLPHLRLTLKLLKPPALKQVIDVQQEIWQRAKAELDLFQDMHKHENQSDAMGGEVDSWLRAIGYMAGENGVFGLDR